MISNNVPGHLLATARTGFLTSAQPKVPAYAHLARTVDLTARSLDLVDVGGSPMPTPWNGKPALQEFIEKTLKVEAQEWVIKVGISRRTVRDDKTGDLFAKCKSAGDNFQRAMQQGVYKALNDGASIIGYDGQAFFSASHVDKGASYITAQSNVTNAALTIDTLEDAVIAAREFVDDQGVFTDFIYNRLVVSPELERTAAGLTSVALQAQLALTSVSAINPYAGSISYEVSNQFDTGTWNLVAIGESTKPVLLVLREAPNLVAATFDADGPDGGMYYFWFGAAYKHYLGDWRLAFKGK